MDLKLETKAQPDKTGVLAGGVGLISPMVNEDYWLYRVQVSPRQAVVAFPKFGTIGIGFQHEKNWNTNLPWTCGTLEIWQHIKCNARGASETACVRAIKMIQEAIRGTRE